MKIEESFKKILTKTRKTAAVITAVGLSVLPKINEAQTPASVEGSHYRESTTVPRFLIDAGVFDPSFKPGFYDELTERGIPLVEKRIQYNPDGSIAHYYEDVPERGITNIFATEYPKIVYFTRIRQPQEEGAGVLVDYFDKTTGKLLGTLPARLTKDE